MLCAWGIGCRLGVEKRWAEKMRMGGRRGGHASMRQERGKGRLQTSRRGGARVAWFLLVGCFACCIVK